MRTCKRSSLPSRGARLRSAFAVAILASALFLGLATTAEAGVVTNWSTTQPVGKVGTNVPVIVRGNSAYDGRPLQSSSLKLYVDGTLVPRLSYTGSVLSTSVYVYYNPAVKFSDGLRTFRVEVSDSAGRLSFREWTATIAQAPSATWLSPAAGSTIYSGTPTVSMALADNTPGTTFTVDGTVRSGSATGPVAATFSGASLAAGNNELALSAELPAGTYYLTATVTDAAGNAQALSGSAARPFTVVAPPAMSVLQDCDGCHASYRTMHPTPPSVDCMMCHPGYDGDHMEGTEYCWDCHWDGWHTGNTTLSVSVSSSCDSCHSATRPEVVQHTPTSVEPSHTGSCGTCHIESLVARHAVTPAGSSYAYQCDLCHSSTDPEVVAAISAGDTACSACHGGPDSGHEAVHTLERTDYCNSCHEGPSLTSVHIANGSLTCDSCHESEDPEVVAAIAANDLACSGCHVTAGVDFHQYVAATHTATAATPASITIKGVAYGPYACSACHGLELGPEHDKSTATSAPADCDACHPSPRNTLSPWAEGCAQGGCHTAGSTAPMHASIDVKHNSPTVSCTTGSFCHSASSGLAALHTNASTVVGGQTRTSCQVCHADGIPATSDCATCHNFAAHPAHTVGGTCISANCHVADAMTIHGQTGGPGCDACHADGVTATFACRACHTSPHPNSVAVNHGPASDQCTSCHATSNIMGVHGDNCDSCHPTPAGPTAVYAGGCEQAGCHPGVHADPHGPYDHGDGTNCGNCHSTTDYGCDCHSYSYERAKPVTTTNAVGSYTGVAAITISAVDQGAAYFTAGVKATYHQLDGQDIETGPFVIVTGPASGTERHSLEYWSVDNHYNTEAHHIIYFTIAAGPPDTTPPSGTMSVNNGAAYATGSTNVNSNVTGCDAGMRVDPGTGVYGSWVPYNATQAITFGAGDGLKTVNVQYRDGANNILTLSDQITVDRTAPAGSIVVNGGASATNAALITISASITDSLSGVTQMSFSTGAGYGPWEPYGPTGTATLTAGSGTKTVWGRFMDGAGNVYTTWDTIIYDTLNPTGTMSINGGAAYTSAATVTLNSAISDTPSGLRYMRFSNDGSSWSAWENYNTTKAWTLTAVEGAKIVYAEYQDWAGNVFATNDAIVLGSTTDTTPPTGSVSINAGSAWTNNNSVTLTLSATDAGSGVYQMCFSNDNVTYTAWETYATSKAWTMSTAAASTKYVYVKYRDAAGNASGGISDSIGFDTSLPYASVVINSGAFYTDSQTVTLGVSGSESIGESGLADMRFSNDGTNWSAWEPYAASKSWTLTAGASHKWVYVQLRDRAGNVSSSASDTIAYQLQHTLTYTAGANGTISGTSPQVVNYGGSGTAVTAVPNTGYKFIGWSDGITTNPRTDGFVAGNVNATALFAANSAYTVQFLTDGNGYLTGGQWIQGVSSGGSTTAISASPYDSSTYSFDYWESSTGARDYSSTLQRTNVTSNEIWTAHFWYSGSCPFLFTWDGTHYRFEADEFAAGYLGLRTSKGYRRPNPIDYHVLATTPAVTGGALEYKLVEERDETDYLDLVKLYAVDAPADRDVWVERSQAEGVGLFTTLDKVIHTTAKNLQPPPSVTWVNTGQDVRDKVASSDGDNVMLNEDRNFAYTYQTLELDLGDVQDAPQTKLVIDGRTMIPTSAEGRAYSRTYGPQVKFEVQDATGKWVAVPSTKAILPKPPEFSRPFVLDLSKIWISDSRKVRLTYLYKTYIDSILLDTTADVPVTLTELPLESADLQPHGFDFKTGIGELYTYLYGEAFSQPRYKLPGNYTKFGDVTPLLSGGVDDKFVIFGGGDEITLRFTPPATSAEGLTRRYLFFSNGYYKTLKEDIPHTVEPLPFAAMSNFPYPDTESYPTDAEHQAYLNEWNTRYESD